MKRKAKKTKDKRIPAIKKDIKDFLFNEEGNIPKKNIVKIGISLAVLGMMIEPQGAQAGHTSHSSHSNSLFSPGGQGGHSSSVAAHSSSHSNWWSHGRGGGWC